MKLITYNGESLSLADWARRGTGSWNTFRNRYNKHHWTIGQCLGLEPPPPSKRERRQSRPVVPPKPATPRTPLGRVHANIAAAQAELAKHIGRAASERRVAIERRLVRLRAEESRLDANVVELA